MAFFMPKAEPVRRAASRLRLRYGARAEEVALQKMEECIMRSDATDASWWFAVSHIISDLDASTWRNAAS